MTQQLLSIHEFGPYRIGSPNRLLLRDIEFVPLTPKCFEILVVLVESSGEIVDKGGDAIMTGRVAQLGDNLLISTELMNAGDNTQIWDRAVLPQSTEPGLGCVRDFRERTRTLRLS